MRRWLWLPVTVATALAAYWSLDGLTTNWPEPAAHTEPKPFVPPPAVPRKEEPPVIAPEPDAPAVKPAPLPPPVFPWEKKPK